MTELCEALAQKIGDSYFFDSLQQKELSTHVLSSFAVLRVL